MIGSRFSRVSPSTSFDRPTIYVERSGGAWEAMYYSEGGKRIYRDTDKEGAVRKAIASTGYDASELRVCSI